MQPVLLLGSGEEIAIPIVLFVVAGIAVCTWLIGSQWRRAREAAYNARLKQLMIEQGMSADEIVRVVEAGAAPRPRGGGPQCGPYAANYERR